VPLSHAAETRFKLEDALNGMQARRLLACRVGQNVERQPDADARSGDDAISEQTYRCAPNINRIFRSKLADQTFCIRDSLSRRSFEERSRQTRLTKAL
jgi:hypothetical protein